MCAASKTSWKNIWLLHASLRCSYFIFNPDVSSRFCTVQTWVVCAGLSFCGHPLCSKMQLKVPLSISQPDIQFCVRFTKITKRPQMIFKSLNWSHRGSVESSEYQLGLLCQTGYCDSNDFLHASSSVSCLLSVTTCTCICSRKNWNIFWEEIKILAGLYCWADYSASNNFPKKWNSCIDFLLFLLCIVSHYREHINFSFVLYKSYYKIRNETTIGNQFKSITLSVCRKPWIVHTVNTQWNDAPNDWQSPLATCTGNTTFVGWNKTYLEIKLMVAENPVNLQFI